MTFIWYGELIWFVVAFLLPASLAARALVRPASPAESAYGWLLVAECAWIVGQAGELSVSELDAKLWLDGLQFFPMCATAALYVVFAHRFVGLAPPRPVLWLLALGAGATSAVYMTAPLHHLVRNDARILPAKPFATLDYAFSAGDTVLGALVLLGSLYSTALLVRYLTQVRRELLPGAVPIALGVALPLVIEIVSAAGAVRILGQRDVSFLAFGVAGLAVSLGMARRRSVVTIPVARERVFDRIPDAALVIDNRGTVLEMNEAAASLLGLPGTVDGIGRSLRTFASTHIELAPLLDDQAGSEPRVMVGQSSLRTFEVTRHVMADIAAELLLVRDITEQAQARAILEQHRDSLEQRVEERTQQLDATERKFRAVFDQTFQLMGILDREGRIVHANKAALSMAAVLEEDVRGRLFWETPWWQHSPALQAQVRDAVTRATAGEFTRFDATHPGPGARLRRMDFSLTPVRDADGSISMLVAEGRDITELREAEEQLQQAQKMEALGRLAGGVAHDFNNLLTVIVGNLDLALHEQQSADAAACLHQAGEAAGSAASLTKQLLAFGRKTLLQPSSIDVGAHLERLTGMLKRVLAENVHVELTTRGGLWPARFDETQLQQVLLNLAINARDAMPNGGELKITAQNVTRPHPGEAGQVPVEWVRIDVADTGSGVTPEHQARIFEPFFTTKGLGKGTGLGLSMVYGALMQNGGFVELRSVPGAGACFSIFCRRGEPGAVDRPAGVVESARRAGEGARVLLVEDEALVRDVTSQLLSRAGFRVQAYSSAEALVERLDDLLPPDILLTDAVMPGMSGYDLVEHVRTRWPALPVVLMSGHSEDGRLKRAIAGGADFVPKPFDSVMLVRILRAALARQPPR